MSERAKGLCAHRESTMVREMDGARRMHLRLASKPTASFLGMLGLLCACTTHPPPPSAKSPLISGIVPGFASKTVSGREFETGEFHGRPFVVSIVSPSCAACETSLRATQAMYADNHDVAVVGVFRGDLVGAARLASDLSLKFPIVADPDGRIARRFEIDEVPRTFVADSQGRISWVGGADLTEEALSSAVEVVK
jgi:peroxiredoxin